MAKQFSRNNWIALGLARLRESGPSALRIDALASAAGRTKGSFYHHFTDLPDYIGALADEWLRTATVDPIAKIEKEGSVEAVRKALARFASRLDHGLERQMRRFAQSDDRVDAVVRASDQRRIAFLVQQFQALGLSEEESRERANIQHCFFVGLQIVFPDADDGFRRKLDAALARSLWPSDGTSLGG